MRALRRSLAEKEGVPNYMIFSDRSLHDLIGKSPSDEADLLGVFGMGEVKAARYGKAILRAIAEASANGGNTL